MNKRAYLLLLLDVLFLFLGFCISVQFKPTSVSSYLYSYSNALIVFLIIWIFASLVFNKYSFEKFRLRENTKQILLSNLSIMAITTILIYLLRSDKYSRLIVFGTIGFTTLIEVSFFSFWALLIRTKIITDDFSLPLIRRRKKTSPEHTFKIQEPVIVDSKRELTIKKAIIGELGRDVYCFFEKVISPGAERTLIVSTTTAFNIANQPDKYYNTIVNLKRVNDIRRINKFFEAVNEKLPKGGIFICMAETKDLRKKRILKKFPPILNYLYYTLDYLLKRVFPKFPLTKGFYFLLTRGENRVLSKAELLGRLYSCGFEAVEEEYVDKHFYVVTRKIKNPAFDLEPTYGPIIKLKRIGKGGKIIKVYKMRTMHPYAEYLQDYVYRKHSLQEGGKFKDDFRVSTLGRFMRKFWLDEIPMLINLLRGEIKLFGVRPLSQHYFNLYSKELQEKRIKFKPGLIPPFYVDNPKTLEEIMASEIKYLSRYEKHPLITDFKYFFIAIYNILIKRYRSN